MAVYRQTRIEKTLRIRADIIRAARRFFDDCGYLAVETPTRIPTPAPEAHIDPEPCGDWCLRASPELCMKRLLCAGYTQIYQIGKCFRKNERGGRHLPEMTLLEWYSVGEDYHGLMAQCEALIGFVAASIGSSGVIDFRRTSIPLERPWLRMTVQQAFETYASMPLKTALEQDCFDERVALEIAPHLGFNRPVFLHDYPLQHASLARLKAGDPALAERFELYVAGVELCNGFSELCDPEEQRRRFENERRQRRQAGKTVYPLPEAFLEALPGMPPAAGCALGVDRLVMLLTDAASIDDVVAFIPEEL